MPVLFSFFLLFAILSLHEFLSTLSLLLFGFGLIYTLMVTFWLPDVMPLAFEYHSMCMILFIALIRAA